MTNNFSDFHFIADSIEELRRDYPTSIKGCDIKVGDRVKLTDKFFTRHSKEFSVYKDKQFVVGSVAWEDENSYELTIRGYPFLVWHTDVELIMRICSWCGSIIVDETNCCHCGGPKGEK
jgi:hypothetical protein